MGSGNSGLYPRSNRPTRNLAQAPINGRDYNVAQSDSVRNVSSVNNLTDAHKVPMEGKKDSVTKVSRDGKMVTERYYDSKGNAYLDIDYTDHGNPKMHPNVPHEHRIHRENGNIIRDKSPEGGIKKCKKRKH